MAPKKTIKEDEVTISVPVVIQDKEKLQQQLRETIAKIDEKLSDLEGTKTVGKNAAMQVVALYMDQYNPSYGGQIQNLQSEANLPLLLNALGRVKAAQRDYIEAAESAGLKKYPGFTWSGHSGQSLIDQLESRIKLLSNVNVINQLKNEKKKLETFLSEDDRLAATLQSLSSLLKD